MQKQNQQKNNLIWLGTIVNTHALKGETKVLTNTDERDFYFKVNKDVLIEVDNEIKKFKIVSIRKQKIFLLVCFKDVNHIDEANKLKGKKIYVEREDLNDDAFYFKDVIGASVIDQNKKELGTVESYYDQKFYYSFEVRKIDNEKFNIPIIDEFIVKFDKDKKILYVNLPEDFF